MSATAKTQSPPDEFLCPITRALMEWPMLTPNGMSYEGRAINWWLSRHDTDPLTREELPTKSLVKNRFLQTKIQEWIKENPDSAHQFRSKDSEDLVKPSCWDLGFVEPPAADVSAILQYRRTMTKAEYGSLTPSPVAVDGTVSYEFRLREDGKALEVRSCRAPGSGASQSPWVSAHRRVTSIKEFPTGHVVFVNPQLQDALIVPMTDSGKGPCRYMDECTNAACAFDHPMTPCRFGIKCKDQVKCRRVHPEPSSVVPLGGTYPSNQECKFGISCSNKKCEFAHPNGRVVVKRVPNPVKATHDKFLQPLPSPEAVDMGPIPEGATKYSFQGDFVFFFKPFPGAWAKAHFKSVTVSHFDPEKLAYCEVGEYTLEGHYCNAAVGTGGYFALSWWPYEEEAVRTRHESAQQTKSLERWIEKQQQQIEGQQKQIESQTKKIRSQKAELKQQVIAKKQAEALRLEAEERAAKEAARLQEQLRYEQERTRRMQLEYAQRERIRMRDPIHVYALEAGASGSARADWTLILDYHKGAHELEILPPSAGAGTAHTVAAMERPVQVLRVRDSGMWYEFDLIAPSSLDRVGRLPVVPEKLCDGF